MADDAEPRPFAEDDSKNPPPRGMLDRLIRRFSRPAYFIVVLGMYALISITLGIALAPALYGFARIAAWSDELPDPVRWLVLGTGLALSFFVFGFSLMVVVPVLNKVLPTKVRPFKGGYYTLRAAPWFLHNGLFYLVRYTFLPFATLTPVSYTHLRAHET